MFAQGKFLGGQSLNEKKLSLFALLLKTLFHLLHVLCEWLVKASSSVVKMFLKICAAIIETGLQLGRVRKTAAGSDK